MYTVLLLILSNIFMTFAWYGHLRQNSAPLWIAIFASWGIAFFEYCLMIPANRMGYAKYGLSGFQLKIIQEVITLAVFVAFAAYYLKEPMRWNHLVAFVFILAGVYFAFLPKQAEAASNSAITSEAK
ncbi:MAG TPA: DMT family protein [Candidatus Sumerlaeota bacterium]|nr:DMT family protein [Candidatus Sumerlaeota bacterium]HMZ52044.1 DMT family protein [Candidatus Sumerlaeota bacterium]HNM46917.1 DMT family protein [Candidatus Sumerlaeota bacterium]